MENPKTLVNLIKTLNTFTSSDESYNYNDYIEDPYYSDKDSNCAYKESNEPNKDTHVYNDSNWDTYDTNEDSYESNQNPLCLMRVENI